MQNGLSGKVSVITGSGRGIGRAIAIKLAEMGSKVAINDLPDSQEMAVTLNDIENLGIEVMLAPADVTDVSAVKQMAKTVTEKWGKIDILVNNAGIIGKNNTMMRIRENDWDTVVNTNLRGAFLCSKYVLCSMMTQRWGRIINMASIAGTTGLGMVDYSTSKGGLIAFTRSLAHEVGSWNITVNAIAPGYIETKLSQSIPQEMIDLMLSRIALKRLGKPQEVAELAGFIASNAANYITGQVISIDGGFA
jgi:3-oxoacyl-[acyl-carrier protein] reductase